MFDLRRARLGLGAFALAVLAAGAIVIVAPSGAVARARAVAQSSPAPAGTPLPEGSAAPSAFGLPGTPVPGRVLNPGQPTPYPLTTLAPLGSGTPLPFPAYGTPVPGVGVGTPPADAPATLTLQQAIAIGFARSPLLQVARADVDVQAAALRLERAGLLPSFSGSSSFDFVHEQSAGSGGSVSGSGSSTSFSVGGGPLSSTEASFGLSLSQLIYDGGKIAASVQADKRNVASSADTYRRELQTVAYNVAEAYYAYLAAQRTTQVDLEIVREDVVQENLVRAQVRAGTEARADIATTELPTAQARLAVIRAQGAELSAEATFMNAMGLDANDKIQPVDDAPVFTNTVVTSIPVPPYATAVKRALALRPDYDAEVQSLAAARYSLKAASLGTFPTLSAAGSATDESTEKNVAAFRNNQSLGVNLSIPIFDQGVTAANVASARAQLAIANANLQSTALGVQLNVKQALTNLVAASAALTETEQEYATALVNVQSTQAQYRAGVTTLPLLLNAQVQLTQALTDQVTAVYTLRENEQAYLYAVGDNYDPTQFSLPRVAKGGASAKTARAPHQTLLQRLQSAIH
jgi:outer membrane protein